MASRLSNRFLNQKLQYVENGEGRIEIPRDNPIRAMMLYFTITVKGGASNAPTGRKNNHYQNLIKKIKLERDGSELQPLF